MLFEVQNALIICETLGVRISLAIDVDQPVYATVYIVPNAVLVEKNLSRYPASLTFNLLYTTTVPGILLPAA
jgi:hypothetical protein